MLFLILAEGSFSVNLKYPVNVGVCQEVAKSLFYNNKVPFLIDHVFLKSWGGSDVAYNFDTW